MCATIASFMAVCCSIALIALSTVTDGHGSHSHGTQKANTPVTNRPDTNRPDANRPDTNTPPNLDDPTNRLREPGVVQDEGHIQEHLNDETDLKVEDMSAEEMEFHYFRLHDTDNNTKLDGLEILAALSHMMPDEDVIPKKESDYKGKSEEDVVMMEEKRRDKVMDYYVSIIDQVLDEDDFDKDGYLTYIEYALARRRDERNYRKQQSQERRKAAHKKHKR